MTSLVFQRIIDSVRANAPGALDGMILMEFFGVAKDFFQRTDSWRVELSIYVQPDITDYTLVTGDPGFINRLMGLGRVGPDNSDTTFRNGWSSPREGFLIRPGIDGEAVIRIPHPPGVNETWLAEFALTVSDPTDEDAIPQMPQWIVEKYQEAFKCGILSKLMSTPNKPYTNVQMASVNGHKYLMGISQARQDIRHGNNYSSQRWIFPQTFRTRSQRVFR